MVERGYSDGHVAPEVCLTPVVNSITTWRHMSSLFSWVMELIGEDA